MLGQTHLRAWITRTCDTDRQAARMLNMDHTYLSQILSGKRTPGLANAAKIEGLTGIPMEAWLPIRGGTPRPRKPKRTPKPQPVKESTDVVVG